MPAWEIAYEAYDRIDELIEVSPDYVFILLGTNDVITLPE